MVFDITQLRKIRKQIDMTQHKFAKEIGVSQSMVAKIESGKLDPTYSYVKMIEEKIMHLTKRDEKEAFEIMNHKVIFTGNDDFVKDVINIINSKGISQVPVVERGNAIGLVSEGSILNGNIEEIGKKRVHEIMTESPPIIDKHAKLEVIIQLLKFYSILIVKEAGKLIGVITKADVIKCLR